MRYVLGTLAAALAVTAVPVAHAERQEITLDAAALAPPGQRSEKPEPGKWWLKRDAHDWGVPNGLILMTGRPADNPMPQKSGEWIVAPADRFVPYRVPALEVDPKATGWYRIHVGLYHDPADEYIRPRLLARLSDEPYPEYVQPPRQAAGHHAEVYWRAADLTGKKIVIEQPPAPMPHPGHGWLAGLTHLRLVPMTDAEVAAARKELELPPGGQRLFGMLDYTDEFFWWGTAESEEDIRASVYRHRQAGFGRIYWRAFGSHLDNSTAVPEAVARWTDADEKRWCRAQQCKAGWKAYIDLTKKFDPLQVAVAYGARNDCEVHAWVRFTNFNREPYANFWHEHHAEFCAQMLVTEPDPKTGQAVPVKPYRRTPYPRVLSLAYPEVRAFYVKFFKQIASTGTRGILIDLLRHPPIAGYEPIVTEAFRKKYGMDMEERDVYQDPLVQEHLASYLRLFLVDLRKEVGDRIEIAVRCSGPSKYSLRGREWVEQGLINTILDGHWYSGNGPRATMDETVAAAGVHGQALAVAETGDVDPQHGWRKRDGILSPEAIRALATSYSGRGVAHFGLYESTVFTWDPERRRAVRAAGWSYDPTRQKGKPDQ
jgi:hypothetical protein